MKNKQWNRREVLTQLAGASAALLLPQEAAFATSAAQIAATDSEIQIAPVSDHTLRLTILPIKDGAAGSVPLDGSLVQKAWGAPVAKLRGEIRPQTVACGKL